MRHRFMQADWKCAANAIAILGVVVLIFGGIAGVAAVGVWMLMNEFYWQVVALFVLGTYYAIYRDICG